MNQQKDSLYNDENIESNSEDEYIAPNIEFEIVEVNEVDDKKQDAIQVDNKEEPEEFDFPLFTSSTKSTDIQDQAEERGRSQSSTMKISLREPSEERIVNERPESYYFASYSLEQLNQFKQCALTYVEIFKDIKIIQDNQPWKVINLNEYNIKIEQELKKNKKKNRPGKKKRMNKIKCRERKIENLKIMKKLEQEKKKLQFKQKYQRNVSNKKLFTKNKPIKANSISISSNKPKPKYRTE
ncbi:unnamed protein product [Candida verbasci]|uniref:Uncharacterized protein n=1 Tax=Candida verbasci TaxID=1227364 RepID=A0A9W4TV50_9ASCO|nr:unnamed protein product [Candida verbasci]